MESVFYFVGNKVNIYSVIYATNNFIIWTWWLTSYFICVQYNYYTIHSWWNGQTSWVRYIQLGEREGIWKTMQLCPWRGAKYTLIVGSVFVTIKALNNVTLCNSQLLLKCTAVHCPPCQPSAQCKLCTEGLWYSAFSLHKYDSLKGLKCTHTVSHQKKCSIRILQGIK